MLRKFSLILLLLPAVFLSSCLKEPDKIGLDLIPDDERIGVFRTDTITVYAYSVREDSVRTDELVSTNLIGSYYDPVMGRTAGSLYSEIFLSIFNINFGNMPVIDSVILKLEVARVIGDTNTVHTVRVFEMKNNIYYDSIYYSNQSVPVYSERELGRANVLAKADSVRIDSVTKIAPSIRIPLNRNFVNRILNGPAEAYASYDKFKEYFKGLYIVTDPVTAPNAGSFIRLNLHGLQTSLVMYYQNAEKDSLQYRFDFLPTGARFNRFDHSSFSQASPSFRQQVLEGDTLQGRKVFFIQPFGGTKARVQIPYLKELAKMKKVIITDAQLVVSNADTLRSFPVPPALSLVRQTDISGKYVFLEDQYEGEDYFGGDYNSSSKSYRFRITRYVQKKIMQTYDKDMGLILMSANSSNSPERVILNGNKADKAPMKLIVSYLVAN